MAEKNFRFVNIVPSRKKKVELVDDIDTVLCKICDKGFVADAALENHVRMEHLDVYLKGDKTKWIKRIFKTVSQLKEAKELHKSLMKKKTKELVSSMKPTSLATLASEDVSYIIIKGDDNQQKDAHADEGLKRRKVVTKDNNEAKRNKEVQLVTGPFECLEPSNLVADGVCHQMFFSCCEYSVHHRDEHTRRRKGIRCQVCEQPLSPQVADSDLPETCPVCNAGFASSLDLAEHANTAHVKHKPFKCDICQKRFTQQAGVQQHMRMHTGDKPFACTHCLKAFTQKSGLEQHLRIHTKVKPYKCVVCGKAFCQSIHLKQHMRTHTNVAPFQCALCRKRFKQRSHLNYHLKGHNPSMSTAMDEEQRANYIQLMGIVAKELEPNMTDEERVKLESMALEVVEIELPAATESTQSRNGTSETEKRTSAGDDEMEHAIEDVESEEICVFMDPEEENVW